MSQTYHIDPPHPLDYQLRSHLRKLGWAREKDIRAYIGAGEIMLHGEVKSFYHKQMVQESLREVSNGLRIRNELQVVR